MPWGKLYRRELLIGDTMTLSRDIVFGEDLLMIIRASFINELPVQIISEKVYNYRETDQSVSHQFKMTLDYEQKYYKLMIVSIPSKLIGQYLIETVRYRLYAINQIIPALVAEKDYSWRGHAFIMQFMEDAKISKYKMGKRLYALLHWPCVSRIIFSILHVKLTNLH